MQLMSKFLYNKKSSKTQQIQVRAVSHGGVSPCESFQIFAGSSHLVSGS